MNAHAQHHPDNRGIALDTGWINGLRINPAAAGMRADTMTRRRTVKRLHQAAWLLRAISCIDLTTLSGDDTAERVRRLCHKARHPVRAELIRALGAESLELTVAAVCVYHAYVETAVRALAGSGIPVAAVSTGFPAGLSPFPERVAEIRRSVEAGAGEIDVVITRSHVLRGEWPALYDEVAAFRETCGTTHMKVILATGDLVTLRNVGRASLVCMMAGADFIKTSTGKEAVNAILPVGLVMARAIRHYHERTGMTVGFKPAGGISTARVATDWLAMIREELGMKWLCSGLFRFGASSLLGDIERQIEHYVTGRYSAAFHHPMG